MLPRKHPDGIHIAFDDHRLVNNAGLILPATLALHLGLPQLVDRHLDLGRAPGRANTGDKMMTLVASALAGGDCIDDADALRTGGMACTLGGTLKAPSTLGTFPAQLPVGPRPPAGPGEPRVAGPGLGDWGRTRRRAIHHRPRFHHLRDLRSGQGGRAPPRLYRQAGLSPAVGRGRRHRGRADVPAARAAGDGGTGALRRGQRTTHATGRQRVLHSWRGIRLPQDGCPLLHHHPPAQEPAQSHRGDTRGCLDSHSLLDGRRRRCGRDHPHSLPE